jgi:hypothetical protein
LSGRFDPEQFVRMAGDAIVAAGADVLRVPAIHKDGRTLSIAFTVTLMRAPDTQAWVIAAIIRDETTRWNEERELRRRLAELEAKWT